MKIVINAFSARLGGGQTYLMQLLSHLPAFGIEVVLYAPESLIIPNDPRIRRQKTRWPVENPLLRAAWERFVLPSILRRERADILFCPGGVVATKVPADCKTVTMFRNMMPFTPDIVDQMPWGPGRFRYIILHRVLLQSFASADLTIFISNHARSVVERAGAVKKGIVIVHGIGDDFRSHDMDLPKPDLAPDTGYLLYVSRFEIYKHHRQVVEGFANLPPEIQARYPLVLIGEDDLPEADAVRQLVGELQMEDRVWIMGAVGYRELPSWYKHAKLVIFASSCENCPNILLESLGSGRPVLSSDVMPMPEFGGPDIAYFDPRAPESLTQSMHAALTDGELERRLGAASIAASKGYDWSLTAKRTWDALRDVMKAS